MGKAKPYISVHANCTLTIDPITGSPQILNAKGKEANAFQIMGYLFVAGAHFLKDLFTGADNQEMSAAEFASYLENTNLEVKQDANGNYYIAAGDKNVSEVMERNNHIAANCDFPEPKPNYTVKSKDGQTIIQINNLTVNISVSNAEHMYVNPEKVVNIFQKELQLEIEKLVRENT